MELGDFRVNDRVELHPACGRWMMGDRYAMVRRIGTKLLTIRFDLSGDTRKIHPNDIGRITGNAEEG